MQRTLLTATAIIALVACSDNTKSLSPGQHYTVNEKANGMACAGTLADIDAIDDDSKSTAERYDMLSADGGNVLKQGDVITILGFGSGLDAPIHVRVERTQRACWLYHGTIDDDTD